jgi:hypothetical protein
LRILISIHSTLYGVTKPVTEVTNLVAHEESLTVLEFHTAAEEREKKES